MIKTRDEIISAVKAKIGEDTSDESLALLEDVSDTLEDLETRASDTTDWKTKYEENDADWRQRYRDRFMSGKPSDNEEDISESEDESPAPKTFADLFSTK